MGWKGPLLTLTFPTPRFVGDFPNTPAVTMAMSRIPHPAGRPQFPLLGERPREPLIGKVSKPIGVTDLGKTACEGQFPTGRQEALSPRQSVYGRN